MFEGVVLKRQGGGLRETFTVRRIASGVGVERTWPAHSPRIDRIEVVRRGLVRRAKLNYLRDRVGKASKVKEMVPAEELTSSLKTRKAVKVIVDSAVAVAPKAE